MKKILESYSNRTLDNKKSKMPARVDFLQSATGLFLIIFMVIHTFLVSSILLGEEFMYKVTVFFEGKPIFGKSYPILVSLIGIFVVGVVLLHAWIAVRKFPQSYKQWKAYRAQMATLKHKDTNKWFYQVTTGFALFFLITVHVYIMITKPETIGPYQSSMRVYGYMAPLYILLLIAVEIHMMIGFYRLCVKWGWFDGNNPTGRRKFYKTLFVGIEGFLLTLGMVTLLTYYTLGKRLDESGRGGEVYQPGNETIHPLYEKK